MRLQSFWVELVELVELGTGSQLLVSYSPDNP
jgi:hypothetical protein